MRFPNDPIAFAVVPQMASPRAVSDDQDVSLCLLRRSVQRLRNIAAIDDDLGLRAHVLLKLGDLFGGEADDPLLSNGIDMGSAGTPDLYAGRDVDKRQRRIEGRSQFGGQRRGVTAVSAQIHRAEDPSDRELARRWILFHMSACPHRAVAFV